MGKILMPRNYEKMTLAASPHQFKRVVFCCPGNAFTNHFVPSIMRTAIHCYQSGISFAYRNDYSPNIFAVRKNLLRGEGYETKKDMSTPFYNQIEYDYIMWIDSDMVWVPEQFQRLLDLGAHYDIVSGITQMHNGLTNIGKPVNLKHIAETGIWEAYTITETRQMAEPFEAEFAGFAFMLMKRGVCEKVGYPWFKPRSTYLPPPVDQELWWSEDISFCLDAKDAGFKVMVDPTIELGHEKTVVKGGRFDEPTW